MIGTSRDTFETWWSEYADIDSDKDSAKDAWQASRKALEAEITLLRALIQKAQSESELIEYKGKAAIVVPYSFMRAATEMPEPAQAVEPVAWMSTDCIGERCLLFTKPAWEAIPDKVEPLYTCPAQQVAVPDAAIIKEIERAIVDHCTGGDLWMSANLGKDRIKRLMAPQGDTP